MKAFGNLAVAATATICVPAMLLSVYPGVLNDLLFRSFFVGLLVGPAAAILLLITVAVLAYRGKLKSIRPPWMHVAVCLAMLFGAYVLLKLYVPRRIAFAVSRSAFEELAPQAIPATPRAAVLNRRVGVYRVQDFAADPRGGIYFRVHEGSDGLGPDSTSYGFARNPNHEGTPYGAAHYRTFPLGGDWHWFRASDDYF